MSVFPTTRHSVLERLRSPDDAPRREALDQLAVGYWKPVYKYLRVKWGLAAEDAEDAAQAFFAEACEKGWFESYEPDKARFRTFVRVCVDRLVMNRRQAAGRMRRGGAVKVVNVDFAAAESELPETLPTTAPDADAYFEREFVRALFARAVSALHADCLARGRTLHWTLFERYDLADTRPAYAALAAEFGLTTGQVTGYLAQMRSAFRKETVAALESLSASRDDFRRDARALLGLEID